MALYTLPKQYSADFNRPNKKPIGEVIIDWSNPLTRGLTHYFKIDGAGYARDLVLNSNNGTTQGTAPIIKPNSIITTGNTGSFVNLPINVGSFNGFGIIVGGRRISGSVSLSVLDDTDVLWDGFYLEGILTGRTSSANSFDGRVDLVLGGVPLEAENAYTAYSLSSGDFRGSANGGEIAQDISLTIPASNPQQVALGISKRSLLDNESESEFLYVGVYNRALTSTELVSLSADPYQVLRPKIPIVYFSAAASGVISGTITQTAESFTQSAVGAIVNPTFTGTIDQTAQSFTQAAIGASLLNITGTITQSASAFTQSLSGSIVTNITGAINQTLNSFTQSLLGSVAVPVTGNINQTALSFTQSAVGITPVQWIDKLPASTTWTNQAEVTTTWTNQVGVSTIWTDKV